MWIALSLIILSVAYRLLAVSFDVLPNVAPLMAIAFCGAVYLPRRWALVIPMGALLLSDLALNYHYGVSLWDWSIVVSALCYLLAAGLGFWASETKTWKRLLGGCVAGSIFFYVATNAMAWLQYPQYAKTFAGLWQSLTTGLPGYPPSWMFFRNSLASDLAFTVIFVLCMEWSRRSSAEESPTVRSATQS